MKLGVVTAHTMDFVHFFKLQYAMMKMYEPNISITAARSNTLEQFTDDVTWVDIDYPDYIHESHRVYPVKHNVIRTQLTKMVDVDRVAWIDADILPIVPSALTEFLMTADKPTVAENVLIGDHMHKGWHELCGWYGVDNLPCHNCGLVAAPKNDPFWDEWQEAKKELYLKNLDKFLEDDGSTSRLHYGVPIRLFFIDQISLNYVIHKDPSRFNYLPSSYNFQPIEPEGNIFIDTIKMPYDTKILHLSGPSKKSILVDMGTVNV